MSEATATLPAGRRSAHYVIKISKFCNLRCTYCYEYTELGAKERMSLDQIAALFRHALDYALEEKLDYLKFIWHGGEPFLIPIAIYDAIGAMQREILGNQIGYLNVAQTNLTVLTDKHLELLKSKRFFGGIGISFDVYGDQRVDARGMLKTETVLRNMNRLIEAKIEFGAIVVLARNTLPHTRQIYRFYDQLGIRCRFLPFYLSAFEAQVDRHALTFNEMTIALAAVFDDWLASATATTVYPLQDYIWAAIAVMTDRKSSPYHKYSDEIVFLVNTDGATHGVADSYDPAYSYGNIFCQPMRTLIDATGRMRAVHESEERLERYCKTCPYFGYCPSDFVVDATLAQRQLLEDAGCPVRYMITHIVQRLQQKELSTLFEDHFENTGGHESAALSVPL